MLLLICPPAAKPCEPPAGIARLAGVLSRHGVPCTLVDGSLEAVTWLLGRPLPASDTWSRRAGRNLASNLAELRRPGLYTSTSRYQRAVRDVNRVLAQTAGAGGTGSLSLANYQEAGRSPLQSRDLLQAADRFEESPFFPWFSRRLTQVIEAQHPSMIGLSLNYLSQALCTFAMLGFVKRRFPALPTVLGGGLVTSWASRPGWSNPFAGLVDHLVAGPGERKVVELLGVTPVDTACPPDYTSLADNPYLAPGFILPYAASSGCYWNKCSFCPETAEGNSYRQLVPAEARRQLAGLIDRYRPVLLHLLDNAVSPALLHSFAAEPVGVSWYGFARVSPLLGDPGFCMQLRRSGCVMLKLGLESGDQAVLDGMRKGIDLDLVSLVLDNLRRAGIATYVYLLFGTPGESYQQARKTMDFVVRHQRAITFLNLAIFNMPVSSGEATSHAVHTFYEGDLSLYCDFDHPNGFSRKAVRRFLDREFKRHPAIAPILHRDPPFFSSNHAPFFGG